MEPLAASRTDVPVVETGDLRLERTCLVSVVRWPSVASGVN